MTHRPTLADWIPLAPYLIDPVAVTTTELDSLRAESGTPRYSWPLHIFGCRVVEVPDTMLTGESE